MLAQKRKSHFKSSKIVTVPPPHRPIIRHLLVTKKKVQLEKSTQVQYSEIGVNTDLSCQDLQTLEETLLLTSKKLVKH